MQVKQYRLGKAVFNYSYEATNGTNWYELDDDRYTDIPFFWGRKISEFELKYVGAIPYKEEHD
jgi:hypothetical protein